MVSFLTNAALRDVKAQVGAILRSLEMPAAKGKSVKKIQVKLNWFLLFKLLYKFCLYLKTHGNENLVENLRNKAVSLPLRNYFRENKYLLLYRSNGR